jgi:hypothetical protein
MTYGDLADLLEKQTKLLAFEWRCAAPQPRTIVPQELEAACDIWCCNLAKNLDHPLDAPKPIRPWILARLVTAAVFARICADEGEPPIPDEDKPAAIVAYMLIAAWHGSLKERWRDCDKSWFSA